MYLEQIKELFFLTIFNYFCFNRSSLDSKSVCSLTSLHETVASLRREEKHELR